MGFHGIHTKPYEEVGTIPIRQSCSAILSASHVTAARVVESVGNVGSLGAGFSEALGTGLLLHGPQ